MTDYNHHRLTSTAVSLSQLAAVTYGLYNINVSYQASLLAYVDFQC